LPILGLLFALFYQFIDNIWEWGKNVSLDEEGMCRIGFQHLNFGMDVSCKFISL